MPSNESKNRINTMSPNVVFRTDKEGSVLKHEMLYEEFVLWSATPRQERLQTGIISQKQFAEYHHISERTLNRWRERSDYWKRIKEIRLRWADDRTSDVLGAIYMSAMRGNAHSQRLWAQCFLDLGQKNKTPQKTEKELSMNDIRFLINLLPEPKRAKHYAFLRELLDDLSAYQRERDREDAEAEAAWQEEQRRSALNAPVSNV